MKMLFFCAHPRSVDRAVIKKDESDTYELLPLISLDRVQHCSLPQRRQLSDKLTAVLGY